MYWGSRTKLLPNHCLVCWFSFCGWFFILLNWQKCAPISGMVYIFNRFFFLLINLRYYFPLRKFTISFAWWTAFYFSSDMANMAKCSILWSSSPGRSGPTLPSRSHLRAAGELVCRPKCLRRTEWTCVGCVIYRKPGRCMHSELAPYTAVLIVIVNLMLSNYRA